MKALLIFLFLLSTNCIVYTQSMLEFGYANTQALKTFHSMGYNNGGGYSISYLAKPINEYRPIQVQFGLNVNHFYTGAKKETIILQEPKGAEAYYQVKNRNSAISFKTRFITYPKTIRFHTDIDLGYRGFKSKEAIILKKIDTNYQTRQDSILVKNGAFFTGITCGLLFKITESFSIDIYSRIDYGLQANWLNINTVNLKNDIPQYNEFLYNKTETPILWIGINATFNFSSNTNSNKSTTSESNRTTPVQTKSENTPKPKTNKSKTQPNSPPTIERKPIKIKEIPPVRTPIE